MLYKKAPFITVRNITRLPKSFSRAVGQAVGNGSVTWCGHAYFRREIRQNFYFRLVRRVLQKQAMKWNGSETSRVKITGWPPLR